MRQLKRLLTLDARIHVCHVDVSSIESRVNELTRGRIFNRIASERVDTRRTSSSLRDGASLWRRYTRVIPGKCSTRWPSLSRRLCTAPGRAPNDGWNKSWRRESKTRRWLARPRESRLWRRTPTTRHGGPNIVPVLPLVREPLWPHDHLVTSVSMGFSSASLYLPTQKQKKQKSLSVQAHATRVVFARRTYAFTEVVNACFLQWYRR